LAHNLFLLNMSEMLVYMEKSLSLQKKKMKQLSKVLSLVLLLFCVGLFSSACTNDNEEDGMGTMDELYSNDDVDLKTGYLSYSESQKEWSISCPVETTIDVVDLYRITNPAKDLPKGSTIVEFAGTAGSSAGASEYVAPAGTTVYYIQLTTLKVLP